MVVLVFILLSIKDTTIAHTTTHDQGIHYTFNNIFSLSFYIYVCVWNFYTFKFKMFLSWEISWIIYSPIIIYTLWFCS